MDGDLYNKRVYVLSLNKEWDEEEANKAYDNCIYPYKIKFFSFAYEKEKNWD